MQNDKLSARSFGTAFKGFLEQAATGAATEEPIFARRIREHLGADPTALEIVARQLDVTDRPNLQVALDCYLAADGRSADLLGFTGTTYRGMSLTTLVAPCRTSLMGGDGTVQLGPVSDVDVDLGQGRSQTCLD